MIVPADLFLLDMDGTLYLSNEVIHGAVDAVNRMRASGRVLFLTNNSSKSKSAYLNKLQSMGFCPNKDEVFTSGMCAAEYLSENHKGDSVYVLGTAALKTELSEWGVRLCSGKETPSIVLLGYDTEMTYDSLAQAAVHIRNGATYYATHTDVNCPAVGGYVPDAGAFIQLIKASTGREPSQTFGKPSRALANAISKRFSLPPNRIAMIGDRLYTDITFAKDNGFISVLVLSGETTPAALTNSPITPDHILTSIHEIE